MCVPLPHIGGPDVVRALGGYVPPQLLKQQSQEVHDLLLDQKARSSIPDFETNPNASTFALAIRQRVGVPDLKNQAPGIPLIPQR